MKLVTLQPVEGAQKRVDIKVGKTIIGRGPLLEVSAGSYRGARASSTPPEAESSLGETDKNRALETPSTPPPSQFVIRLLYLCAVLSCYMHALRHQQRILIQRSIGLRLAVYVFLSFVMYGMVRLNGSFVLVQQFRKICAPGLVKNGR